MTGGKAQRTALITGASAGIGTALAHEYARHGYNLLVTARRAGRLNDLATDIRSRYGVEVAVFPADLADPDAPDLLAAEAGARGIAIDALVNNAGYGIPQTFRRTDWRAQADFIQVMVTAVAHLSHLVLPGMVERGFGRILNVASVAGLMPGAKGHTTYGASKSFLIRFSQSLWVELQGTGVHVTALCPGLTYSEFHDVTGVREQVSKLPGFLWMTAQQVAAQGYRAAERNKAIHVPGLVNKTMVTLVRFLPDSVALNLSSRRSRL